MGTLITFLAGAERTSQRVGCQIIAAFIQYFVLSTFCWMACEGFNLYRNFVQVFKMSQDENAILLRVSLFSWGKFLVLQARIVQMQSFLICPIRRRIKTEIPDISIYIIFILHDARCVRFIYSQS